jgi:hypothetical protein
MLKRAERDGDHRLEAMLDRYESERETMRQIKLERDRIEAQLAVMDRTLSLNSRLDSAAE